LAICCKISALGLRSPRSIWLRYGLDTPAAEESCRSEILACSRCWRMYSPMEPTFTGFTPTVNQIALAIANAKQARNRGQPGFPGPSVRGSVLSLETAGSPPDLPWFVEPFQVIRREGEDQGWAGTRVTLIPPTRWPPPYTGVSAIRSSASQSPTAPMARSSA